MEPFIDLDDLEHLAEGQDCPFCGHDPFHYVDVGVGSVPVAVTCCDLGIGFYQHHDEQISQVVEKLRLIARELLTRRRFDTMACAALPAAPAHVVDAMNRRAPK